jgi:hypothetical protein
LNKIRGLVARSPPDIRLPSQEEKMTPEKSNTIYKMRDMYKGHADIAIVSQKYQDLAESIDKFRETLLHVSDALRDGSDSMDKLITLTDMGNGTIATDIANNICGEIYRNIVNCNIMSMCPSRLDECIIALEKSITPLTNGTMVDECVEALRSNGESLKSKKDSEDELY